MIQDSFVLFLERCIRQYPLSLTHNRYGMIEQYSIIIELIESKNNNRINSKNKITMSKDRVCNKANKKDILCQKNLSSSILLLQLVGDLDFAVL